MTGIQHAQLHQLVGHDIGHEFDPDLLQRRAALREVVLQHPLPERFADHRHRIVDAEALGNHRANFVCGGGRDAIHHAVRERDALQQGLLAPKPGQTAERILCDVAASRQVVAGQDRKRRMPVIATRLSAARIIPKTVRGSASGAASAAMSGWLVSKCPSEPTKYPPSVTVSDTMRMRGSAIAAIVAAGATSAKPHIGRADTRGKALRIELDDGRKPVLRRQPVPHPGVARPHAGADDAPVKVAAPACRRSR